MRNLNQVTDDLVQIHITMKKHQGEVRSEDMAILYMLLEELEKYKVAERKDCVPHQIYGMV